MTTSSTHQVTAAARPPTFRSTETATLLSVVQALTMARAAAQDKFVKQAEIRVVG